MIDMATTRHYVITPKHLITHLRASTITKEKPSSKIPSSPFIPADGQVIEALRKVS